MCPRYDGASLGKLCSRTEKSATFLERHPLESRTEILALELLNHRGWFVCHENRAPFALKAMKENTTTAEFQEQCLFIAAPARRPKHRHAAGTKKNGDKDDQGTPGKCLEELRPHVHFVNPLAPKSDQRQISPAASPEIVHRTVWRTWLFIAHSDGRRLYQFSLPNLYISP